MMIGVKYLVFGLWLSLVLAYHAEQAICPLLLNPVNLTNPSGERAPSYYQADALYDFFLPPPATAQVAPVPIINEPHFKWKPANSARVLTPCAPFRSYPELVQDIWRCPTVAFVLFPFHEFL